MIILMPFIFALLALIDVPKLVKGRYWRELIIYSAFMTIAFTLTVLSILDVTVPDPARDTQYAVAWLFKQIHLAYD